MAVGVIWSEAALADLKAIADYIARDSRVYAAATLNRFVEAVELLARFPGMGRRLPEMPRSAYRDWIVGVYRIVYRIDVQTRSIFVIAIVHGMRQLNKAIGPRLKKRPRKK